MKRLLLLSFFLALALSACKEDEPKETRSFFDTRRAATGPQQGTLPQGHPPIGGGMGGTAAPGGATAPEGTPVLSGTITVAGALAGQVPQGILFITARMPAAEGKKGQAVLVKRVAAPTFPYAFELTTSNSMMGGAPVPDTLAVEAHLDQDGDAISRTPGDVEGESKASVTKGAKDVAVVLDRVVKDAKPGMRIAE